MKRVPRYPSSRFPPLARAITCALALGVVDVGSASAEEAWTFSLGARLQFSGWEGENRGSSETDFDADGALLGFSASARKGRFYAGATFTGGEFDFERGSPDQVSDTGSAPHQREATIDRGEADLLVGYWFWDRVSLFADIKSVSNEWRGEDYSLRYNGLGFGVSGFYPLSDTWTLFASFGVVPLTIRAEGEKIGDGGGSALEFGGILRLTPRDTLVFSLKNQHQEYEFDNGAEQTHDLGGFAVAYTHRFGAE